MKYETREELEKALQAYVGKPPREARWAPDLVNEPMIRHWCEAMGDANPVYTDPEAAAKSLHGGIVAPPTMLQAWTLEGIAMAQGDRPPETDMDEIVALCRENGYPSVVATNCEQGYARYLRPGDRIAVTSTIESVSEQKATALGIGYFIEKKDVFRDQHGEEVGWMLFRILMFQSSQPQPAADEGASAASSVPTRMRPPTNHDNQWWWEQIGKGVLPIQKCSGCGALRHPPRPMCGACQSTEWEHVAASGRGHVYSFVVMHHPKFPGYEYPLVVGLIELEEGTRLVSNVVGCEPDAVRVGMPVQVSLEKVDDELTLPLFRPVDA